MPLTLIEYGHFFPASICHPVVSSMQPDDDDPRPIEPPPPDFDACCGQGCNPCIFDLYEMARAEYAAKLRAWEERQTTRKSEGSDSG